MNIDAEIAEMAASARRRGRRAWSASLLIGYALLWWDPLYVVGDTAVTGSGHITGGWGGEWVYMPLSLLLAPYYVYLIGVFCLLGTLVCNSCYLLLHAVSAYLFMSAFLYVLSVTLSFTSISDIFPCGGLDVVRVLWFISAHVVSVGACECDRRSHARSEYDQAQPGLLATLALQSLKWCTPQVLGVFRATNIALLVSMPVYFLGSAVLPVLQHSDYVHLPLSFLGASLLLTLAVVRAAALRFLGLGRPARLWDSETGVRE